MLKELHEKIEKIIEYYEPQALIDPELKSFDFWIKVPATAVHAHFSLIYQLEELHGEYLHAQTS